MKTILIALSLATVVNFAHADELDPAYYGRDVRVCRGTLTTNGVCIGSESNVAPDSYEGTMIYRPHHDGGRHRQQHR